MGTVVSPRSYKVVNSWDTRVKATENQVLYTLLITSEKSFSSVTIAADFRV